MALKDSLISFWELEEASGTRVDAVTASGNNLTDNNTVTQNPGKVGQAAQFNRVNEEYLSRASNASLQCGDIDFTVLGWIYMDDETDNNRIIAKDHTSPAGAREYLLTYRQTSDRFEYFVFTPTDVAVQVVANTFGAPTTATWYFVVAWHNASANTINIQVNDGGVDSTATGGALQAAGGAEFRVGAAVYDGGGFGFHSGRLDQAGFWKRVLTPTERTWLYNSGNGRSYAEILTWDAAAAERLRLVTAGGRWV